MRHSLYANHFVLWSNNGKEAEKKRVYRVRKVLLFFFVRIWACVQFSQGSKDQQEQDKTGGLWIIRIEFITYLSRECMRICGERRADDNDGPMYPYFFFQVLFSQLAIEVQYKRPFAWYTVWLALLYVSCPYRYWKALYSNRETLYCIVPGIDIYVHTYVHIFVWSIYSCHGDFILFFSRW